MNPIISILEMARRGVKKKDGDGNGADRRGIQWIAVRLMLFSSLGFPEEV